MVFPARCNAKNDALRTTVSFVCRKGSNVREKTHFERRKSLSLNNKNKTNLGNQATVHEIVFENHDLRLTLSRALRDEKMCILQDVMSKQQIPCKPGSLRGIGIRCPER